MMLIRRFSARIRAYLGQAPASTSDARELAHGAGVAFVLKIVAAIATFALSVTLARLLGPAGAGLFFLGLTGVTIAAAIGRGGLDKAVVRHIAASAAVGDWSRVNGVYKRGMQLGTAGALLAAAALWVLAEPIAVGVFDEPALTSVNRWMAISVVPFALLLLIGQMLQGLKRIRDAITVLSVLLPLLTLVGALLLVPANGVLGAVWAHSIAGALTLMYGLIAWRRSSRAWGNVAADFPSAELSASTGPLFWVAVLQLLTAWAPTIALGVFATEVEVGIFESANRTARLTNFVLIAVNSIAAPQFAAFFKVGDTKALERSAQQSVKLMTLMSLPVVLVFLLVPGPVMRIFGPGFAEGAPALAILALGQFINVITGSVGFLLMMCGEERLMRNNLVISAVLCAILQVALVPTFGIQGAAIAGALTLASQNLLAFYFVRSRLKIQTIPAEWMRLVPGHNRGTSR